MRYWRALLWLVPVATLVPLGYLVYGLANVDYKDSFAGVAVADLLVVIGVPSAVVLGGSLIGAISARTHPPIGLIAVSGVWALMVSPLVWQPEFWDSHSRLMHLVFFTPGVIAGVLAVWGWFLLRRSSRGLAIASAILLLLPVASTAGGVGEFAVERAHDCPPGPAIDLTFSGLENAHFTTSCGVPTTASTLAGCRSGEADIEMFDFEEWNLQLRYSNVAVTSDDAPAYIAPYLIVGGITSYGGESSIGQPTWKGTYSFDSGSQCAGSINVDLFTGFGPGHGAVHVSGQFDSIPR